MGTNTVIRYLLLVGITSSTLIGESQAASPRQQFNKSEYLHADKTAATKSNSEISAIGLDDSSGTYSSAKASLLPVDISAPVAEKAKPTGEEVAATVDCGCSHAWYNKWSNSPQSGCLDEQKQQTFYNSHKSGYSNPWSVYWGFAGSNSNKYSIDYNSKSQVMNIYKTNGSQKTNITSIIKNGMQQEKFAIKGSGTVSSGIKCQIAFINPVRSFVYYLKYEYKYESCHYAHHGDYKVCSTRKATQSATYRLWFNPGYFYPPENSCRNVVGHAIKADRLSGDSFSYSLATSCSYRGREAY